MISAVSVVSAWQKIFRVKLLSAREKVLFLQEIKN